MTSTDKTIPQILEEVAEDMCDNYCKYPGEYKDSDDMWNEVCDKCPLNKLT